MKYILISNSFYDVEQLSKNSIEFFSIYGNRFSKSMNDAGYNSTDYFLVIGEEDDMMYAKLKNDDLRMYEIKNDDCYHTVKNYIYYILNLSNRIRENNNNRINDYVLFNDLNRYFSNRDVYSDYNLYESVNNFKYNLDQIIERYNQEENDILCFEINLLNMLK